jgi:hypothetical protein
LEFFGVQTPDGTAGAAPRGASKQVGPTVEDLQKQVADLAKQLERSNTERLATIAAGTPVFQQQTPLEQPQVDTSGLPDPITDPEGFNKGLNDRISRAVETAQRNVSIEQSNQQSIQQRADALWEDFSEKYPWLKDKQDLVEFVAGKVAQRAQGKGLDLSRYMFVTPDLFFGDVIKGLGDLGVTQPSDEDPDGASGDTPATAQGAPQRPAQGSEPPDRTAGLFGGQDSGGRPAKGAEQDTPGDMLKDLKDLQRASGYF